MWSTFSSNNFIRKFPGKLKKWKFYNLWGGSVMCGIKNEAHGDCSDNHQY